MKNFYWFERIALSTISISLLFGQQQISATDCREWPSESVSKVQCGTTLPSPVTCTESGTCTQMNSQDNEGIWHTLYLCSGGKATLYDPLYTTQESAPAAASGLGRSALWSQSVRWCSASYGCQPECVEVVGAGMKCTLDSTAFQSGTTLTYWTLMTNNNGKIISCSVETY